MSDWRAAASSWVVPVDSAGLAGEAIESPRRRELLQKTSKLQRLVR
jgi:hypothetical protein